MTRDPLAAAAAATVGSTASRWWVAASAAVASTASRWAVGTVVASGGALAVGLAVALAVAKPWPGPAVRPAPTPPIAPALDELGGATLADLQRRLLNGLLVPLLDSDEPLAWAGSNTLAPCGDLSDVTANGAALPDGGAIDRGRPFPMRWRLADCWPLGTAWLGLDGELSVSVTPGPDALRVVVHPERLTVVADGRRHRVSGTWFAELSLAESRPRP